MFTNPVGSAFSGRRDLPSAGARSGLRFRVVGVEPLTGLDAQLARIEVAAQQLTWTGWQGRVLLGVVLLNVVDNVEPDLVHRAEGAEGGQQGQLEHFVDIL